MKVLKAIILAAALVFPAMLHAAPPAENLAAAKKLADVIGLKEQMNAGFSAMMPMIDQVSVQLKLDAAGKTELIQLYKDWFEKDLDQEKMMNNIVILYAETFTSQELDGLREFYMTPLGKKTLKALPEVMQKGAQLGMEEAKTKEQALMTRLNTFIESKKAAAK